MARSGVRVDEVIQAPGLPVGEVHERLLAAMAADRDYQAVQVGSDRFQFARTFRPTWAIVTACITIWIVLIGIVFLFVKTTETCLAVIESDHRGTRLRLQGRVSAAALGRVRAAMAGEQFAGVPNQAVAPRPLPGSAVTTGSTPAVGMPVASTYPEVERSSAPAALPSTPPPLPPQLQSPHLAAAQLQPVQPAAPQAPAPAAPPAVQPAQPPSPAPVASSGSLPAPAQFERSTLTPDQFAGAGGPQTDDSAVVIPAPPPETGARRSSAAPGDSVAAGNPAGGLRSAAGSATVGVSLQAVLDDGTPVALSALTLIGRDPAASNGEEASLVALEDPTRSVSKTHLAVMRTGDGWAVVDRNSTNGVSIVANDGSEVALTSGTPAAVSGGAVVRFGERSMRLISDGHDSGGLS